MGGSEVTVIKIMGIKIGSVKTSSKPYYRRNSK